MLSTIRLDPKAGNKTIHITENQHLEKMTDLNEGDWWTGVRISSPDVIEVELSFCDSNRVLNPVLKTFTYSTNSLVPLTFPLPARLAKEMDLHILISKKKHGPIVINLTFDTIRTTKKKDRYLFVDYEGRPVLHWDAVRNAWGTPATGAAPKWMNIHTVIPPLNMLLVGGWSDTAVFCIHDWSERFDFS